MESSEMKDKIEKIIFKILYQNMVESKSIESTKTLIELVLENCIIEKITISEKNIKNLILELKNENKIQFNQRDGWKILI